MLPCLGAHAAAWRPTPLPLPQVEASSAYRGIGLVKLMGRQSGFIAMQASMASGVVDIVSGWVGSAVCMLGRDH